MNLHVEENVKIKIVLDYIKSLGFQEDEIDFESSFKLVLGTGSYRIETQEQCRDAGSRLDILAKRNNSNLFIIEVKNDLVDIDDKEVAQATSYAKLVHPVAPFAIITNGKVFHIYDSLTRKEIKQQDFRIEEKYEICLPDDARYEALKHFVGYSKENVGIFCRSFVSKSMSTLLGSPEDRYKKFIPELYVRRKGLATDLSMFMGSSKSVFAILGDSGTGKTCSMCGTALELIKEGSVVLFYRARDFVDSITRCIAEDFNWEFSSEFSDIQVLKRVRDLFPQEKVLLFIDAIDEWDLPNKFDVLNAFVKRLSSINLIVVLSCKTSAWGSFLNQNGTPTYISEELYLTQGNKAGHYLQPLDDQEFHYAVDKYRSFYNFDGLFEDKVLEECKRIPFLLRVFFEVAQQSGIRHLTFTSLEFFNHYHKLMLEKIGKEVGDITLKAIAKLLLLKDSDLVDVDYIRRELGLGMSVTILPSLFEFNILEKVSENFNEKIGFTFAKFRDYLLSQYVIRWNSMTVDEFNLSIKANAENGIYYEALKFYYVLASNDKKSVIDGIIRANANEYLIFYKEVLATHFPNFKASFSPHTADEIGFIGELSIKKRILLFYGFRALNHNDDEQIKFIPVDTDIFSKRSNLSYLHGACTLHFTSSSNGFRKFYVRHEVLKSEIEEQLRDIIKNGLLDESSSNNLLFEKLAAIITKYQAKHHNIKDKYKMSSYLPIRFEQIEYAQRYEKAYKVYATSLSKKSAQMGQSGKNGKGQPCLIVILFLRKTLS